MSTYALRFVGQEGLSNRLSDFDLNQFFLLTAALGLPALREAIAGHYADAHGVDVDPARVVVTPGSSAAWPCPRGR